MTSLNIHYKDGSIYVIMLSGNFKIECDSTKITLTRDRESRTIIDDFYLRDINTWSVENQVVEGVKE